MRICHFDLRALLRARARPRISVEVRCHVTILYAIYDSYAPDLDALGLAPRPRLDVTLLAKQGRASDERARIVRLNVYDVYDMYDMYDMDDVLTSGTTLSESNPVDGE